MLLLGQPAYPDVVSTCWDVAGSYSCPLPKEACLNLNNKYPTTRVMQSSGWKAVEQSNGLLKELLKFSSIRLQPLHEFDYNNMDVRTLRERLELFELELDGTKEMMVQRLKDYHVYSSDDIDHDPNVVF